MNLKNNKFIKIEGNNLIKSDLKIIMIKNKTKVFYFSYNYIVYGPND